MFSIELLQAINDWQRGGEAKQKKKRGEKLRAASANLPAEFRQTNVTCYRQISLDKSSVWKVGTEYRLAETLSSWSESEDVAKEFKGGVPPVGYQGAIFAIKPGTGTVIANLASLFKNLEFNMAIEKNKSEIANFDRGLGKYGDSQLEVVIETDSLPLNSIHAWGGYSSPESKLAKMFYGKAPSDAELEFFRGLMKECGHACGPYWLKTPEAVERVSEKLKLHGQMLSKSKK